MTGSQLKINLPPVKLETTIKHDRELVFDRLGMSCAVAASYLGKRRQSLHNLLNQDPPPEGEIIARDLFVLINFAIDEQGLEFDRDDVANYVINKWDTDDESDPEHIILKGILKLLKPTQAIDWNKAAGAAIVAPGFLKVKQTHPGPFAVMRDTIDLVRKENPQFFTICVSDDRENKYSAGRYFDVDDQFCYYDEAVRNHEPFILLYEKGKASGLPRKLYVTSKGDIEESTGANIEQISGCVDRIIDSERTSDLLKKSSIHAV